MAHLSVQCQNCGAKYKIPETFKSDSAKCKACGSMIDVKAVRDGTGSEPVAESTGGTRKPRQTAATGRPSRRRDSGDETEAKPKRSSRRTAAASSRRGRDREDEGDDEAEEGGRGRYQKKKDNTPMIASVVGLGLAIVALILYLNWNPDAEPTKEDNKKVAAKPDDKNDEKAGDEDKVAAEAAAKKASDAKIAKEAAAKKKARNRPKTKRELAIKKVEDVKAPSDVFKPSSALPTLPKPKDLSDDEFKEISELLDEMRGSGLPAIKARNKLPNKGVAMIPIAVNRILTLDFTKPKDNQYCFEINECIKVITDFELGFEPILAVEDDEFDFKQGHRNAANVWDLHAMARQYWHSAEGLAKYKTVYDKSGR